MFKTQRNFKHTLNIWLISLVGVHYFTKLKITVTRKGAFYESRNFWRLKNAQKQSLIHLASDGTTETPTIKICVELDPTNDEVHKGTCYQEVKTKITSKHIECHFNTVSLKRLRNHKKNFVELNQIAKHFIMC